MLLCGLTSAISFSAAAEIIEVTPADNLRAAIGGLQQGDELVLGGGQYNFDSRLSITVAGSQTQPIVVRARDGERALISMSVGSQNILDVQDSSYLELRGLAFTGGSHGIRLINSDFITIESCEVFETGDVALSANAGGTYEGLLIRGNHIHHTNGTGEGVYLGCNNDTCRVANSIVEWNYIHHTNRPGVTQGDGIELKEGSFGNVIRHNVIHDTNYPGIITYSTVGNGPANIIESNLIWNSNDYGIQSAADSVIRNNIVLGSPIALQAHQAGRPSNQVVVHNTVISDGAGIILRNISGPVVVANNAVYSASGAAIRLISGNTSLVTVVGNIGRGGLTGGVSSGFTAGHGIAMDFVNGHFSGAPPLDVFPVLGSALIAGGAAQYVTELDFNGQRRDGAADTGAYAFSMHGNPGWTLAAAFKQPGGKTPAPTTAFRAD
jgi:hypothetical protein